MRGGGTGGDRPSSEEQKSLTAYSKGANGCIKRAVAGAQIMSIFAAGVWRSDFFSEFLPAFTA
jgi:hypothetical protein